MVAQKVSFFVWFIVILIGILFFSTFITGLKIRSGLESIPIWAWGVIIIVIIKLLMGKRR